MYRKLRWTQGPGYGSMGAWACGSVGVTASLPYRHTLLPLLLTALAASTVTALAQSTPPAALAPRMPVRSGVVVVKVTSFDAARDQALAAAREQGAELEDARTEVDPKGRKHGWMRFRVAADHLPALLTALHRDGKLYAEKVTTQDRISTYQELKKRVSRLRDHEQRLDSVLTSPRRMRGSDILYIQERLYSAGVDESRMLQEREDIERAAQMSKLVVTLFEPGSLPELHKQGMDLGRWFATSSTQARDGFMREMARGATAGAYAIVYAPIWIPALTIVVLLGRWVWRRARPVAAQVVAALRAATWRAPHPEHR